jgi:hypothetical protein
MARHRSFPPLECEISLVRTGDQCIVQESRFRHVIHVWRGRVDHPFDRHPQDTAARGASSDILIVIHLSDEVALWKRVLEASHQWPYFQGVRKSPEDSGPDLRTWQPMTWSGASNDLEWIRPLRHFCGCSITITKGTVDARNSGYGAGIGTGRGEHGNSSIASLTILNATIEAMSRMGRVSARGMGIPVIRQ